MSKKKDQTSKKEETIINSEAKLKAFGIIKDTEDDDIEIDGEQATGGKGETAETHWPTTTS
ncbi:hypothetical protein [Pedobacter gandavensis]|uniref:hypothetical protein n=1 Tax=Pedobacter gandavensis TaxID=2679963 RepID=UPI002931E363|nr:hypothetical protein [Pedobacter gandavensis]